MPTTRKPLFVRLPADQAAALDRLADATGRHKQHVVSELLADRLTPAAPPLSLGRVDVTTRPDAGARPGAPGGDDVLTLEEAAALLKLSVEAVRSRAESGDLPGRRFGRDWRFARAALLDWLAAGESQKRRRP